jgi:hypothetical protein
MLNGFAENRSKSIVHEKRQAFRMCDFRNAFNIWNIAFRIPYCLRIYKFGIRFNRLLYVFRSKVVDECDIDSKTGKSIAEKRTRSAIPGKYVNCNAFVAASELGMKKGQKAQDTLSEEDASQAYCP